MIEERPDYKTVVGTAALVKEWKYSSQRKNPQDRAYCHKWGEIVPGDAFAVRNCDGKILGMLQPQGIL